MWSISKLKVGDFAANTIEPNIKLSALIGKNTEMTEEYFSSASETSRTDKVVSK